MIRVTLIFIAVIVVSIFLFLLLFACAVTPPSENTEGLLKRLSNLDHVVRVEDYFVYEGSASFKLILTNQRSISLSGITNHDFRNSKSIIITSFNGRSTYCRHEFYGTGSNGINNVRLQEQFLPKSQLTGVQDLIYHFHEIEKVFSNLPIRIKNDTYPDKPYWICGGDTE